MAGPGRPRLPNARVVLPLRVDPRFLKALRRRGPNWRRQAAEWLEGMCGWRREDDAGRTVGRGRYTSAARWDEAGRGAAVLICADSAQVGSRLPAFDALVGDPPYGLNYVSRHRQGPRTNTAWGKYLHGESFAPVTGDDQPFDPQPWLLLAGDRPVVLWGANYYADRLPVSGGWLVWDKVRGLSPATQADAELAWTNAVNKPRIYSHLWRGLCRDGEENLSRGGRKLHPNQKPVALMNWVLDVCGLRAGQTVLDPWMGSGTLGVACVRRGIHYIGVEVDARYFEIAKERIAGEGGVVAVRVPSDAGVDEFEFPLG